MLRSLKRVIPTRWKTSVKKLLNVWRRRITADMSQHGESTFISKLITSDFPMILVDIGAFDGKNLSNSYYFVKRLKWKAVMVEPLPKNFRLLQQTYANNPDVICVNKACALTSGTSKLFLASHSSMATLSTDDNEWFRKVRSDESIEVITDTLTNILSECQVPHDFSLLSIDTEGLDYDVLRGLDFSLFQPRLIITEKYHNEALKYALLESKGYEMISTMGTNTIWAKRDLTSSDAKIVEAG